MTGPEVGREAEADSIKRLSWGLRRYRASLLTLVAAVVGLSVVFQVAGPRRTYEASALVVATTLEIDPLQLPRTVDAVFKGGSVAEAVASKLPYTAPAPRIVPDQVRLEPVNDTIVVRVIGRNREPVRAAELADVAAFFLVAELNRLGPGVGQFVLQNRAQPPVRRTGASSLFTSIGFGTLSGATLGLGVLGLLLLARQPVVDGREAAAVVGAPLMVSLELPPGRATVEPDSVGGLSLLTKQLFPAGRGLCTLVDTGSNRPRLQVMRLVAQLVCRTQPVTLVVPSNEQTALTERTELSDVRVLAYWLRRPTDEDDEPLRFENDTPVLFGLSASEFDVPQLIPESARVVILVAEGARRKLVEGAARQFGAGGIQGVVFVTPRSAG